MAPSMGYATRVGMTAISGSGAAIQEFEFDSCDIGKKAGQWQPEGIRGLRGHQSEIVAALPYMVSGTLNTEPRTDELPWYLELIMGTAATYALAETVPAVSMDILKGADCYRYTGMKVNRATFSSRSGQPLRLSMEMEGFDETSGIAFANITTTLSLRQPFMHHELVVSLNSVTYTPMEWELVIDNQLITDRFLNSLTRSALPESGRQVVMSMTLPFTSAEAALYDIANTGLTGTHTATFTKSFTANVTSLGFTFARLQAGTVSPGIPGRNQEVTRRISLVARRLATTPELATTLDLTP